MVDHYKRQSDRKNDMPGELELKRRRIDSESDTAMLQRYDDML